MKIAITDFALRQWQEAAGRKRIVGLAPAELADLCNSAIEKGAELAAGYAPFCTHLFLENTTATVCSFASITEHNRAMLKSGSVLIPAMFFPMPQPSAG